MYTCTKCSKTANTRSRLTCDRCNPSIAVASQYHNDSIIYTPDYSTPASRSDSCSNDDSSYSSSSDCGGGSD